MQNLRKVFGDIIRKHRKRLNMTQFELAEKVGVDHKYISRIETGLSYPSLSVVERIFDVLDVDINYLSDEEQQYDKDELISVINLDLKNTTTKNISLIKDIVKTITGNVCN